MKAVSYLVTKILFTCWGHPT